METTPGLDLIPVVSGMGDEKKDRDTNTVSMAFPAPITPKPG